MEDDLIEQAIKTAKLGRTRKDAQEDTCAAFGAALYDVLTARGVPCRLFIAKPESAMTMWYHSVVRVDGTYYDSMGEFSQDIYRARARVHPKVRMDIVYKIDVRSDCYEEDMHELYEFYAAALLKSFVKLDKQALLENEMQEEAGVSAPSPR